ncbi:PREDICTED: uncharacterized protein LOC101293803 [Fragaria vesca subsp. vesca]|uniref:uncharacterized protein LOC101293803 n=1 Tax=Fragaria vesca subsp. vesca TaxID=101020 RepID=UPI0002C32DA4|nr:PREDICTED: uncharacterized protein LOC101293803 [Fragaria vesca subsp. vesca]
MEESPFSSRGRDEPEFSLRDWAVKARGISRENTNSRRFSASYIRSFREDTRSFRSNITISSTASSPGYALRDEIDPATYSFTTAIKALQARSAYHSWEALSPDGFALHSKWNEAEKYICNPLSGQVPLECLSAKTLSGRSFRNMTDRITMSAPLVYSSHTRPIHTTKPSSSTKEDLARHFPIQEKKNEGMTRDVGTQSTPDISSSSLSSASTPPIVERSLNRFRGGDSPNSNSNSNSKPKSEEEDGEEEMEVKDTEEGEGTKREKEERKKKKSKSGGKVGACHG